ncbi:hypothetical protein LCGC14_2969070, partial [marine sediment metagenome]
MRAETTSRTLAEVIQMEAWAWSGGVTGGIGYSAPARMVRQ